MSESSALHAALRSQASQLRAKDDNIARLKVEVVALKQELASARTEVSLRRQLSQMRDTATAAQDVVDGMLHVFDEAVADKKVSDIPLAVAPEITNTTNGAAWWPLLVPGVVECKRIQ